MLIPTTFFGGPGGSSSVPYGDPGPQNALALNRDHLQYLKRFDADVTVDLDIDEDFTVEAWVRPIAGEVYILSRNYVEISVSTVGIRVDLDNLGIAQTFSVDLFQSTWHHVAVSADLSGANALIKYYLDGQYLGSDTITGVAVADGTTGDLLIGRRRDGLADTESDFCYAQIKDVRYWDDIRSDAEIAANYRSELTGAETNLKGFWKLQGDARDYAGTNDFQIEGDGIVPLTGAFVSSDPFSQGSVFCIRSNSQYLYNNTPTLNDSTTVLTVEAWVAFNGVLTTGNEYTIASVYNGATNGGWKFYLYKVSSFSYQLRFAADNGSSTSYAAESFTFDGGQWYHIAVRVDLSEGTAANRVQFVVNGNDRGTPTTSISVTSMASNSNPLQVGASESGNFMDGWLADVRIWNTRRTVAEIAADYTRTLVGNETNLQAYLRLFGDANDLTANANNLTLSGAPTYSGAHPISDPGYSLELASASSQYLSLAGASVPTSWELVSGQPSIWIDGWFLFNSASADQTLVSLNTDVSNENYRFYWDQSVAALKVRVEFTSFDYYETAISWTPSTDIWYQIQCQSYFNSGSDLLQMVLVIRDTYGTVLVNTNDSTALSAGNTPVNTGTPDFEIGSWGQGTDYFDGLIHNLRMWNATATEWSTNNLDDYWNRRGVRRGDLSYLIADFNLQKNTFDNVNDLELAENASPSFSDQFPYTDLYLPNPSQVPDTPVQAASFDDSQSDYAYITDANQSGLDLASVDGLTFEAWVEISSLFGTNGIRTIFSKYDEDNAKRSYRFFVVDESVGDPTFAFTLSDDGTFDAGHVDQRGAVITSGGTGTWYHLAVTIDLTVARSSGTTFYLNGVDQGAGTASDTANVSSIYDGNHDFIVGAHSATRTDFWDGYIFQARIWNRVRTENEINLFMNRPIGPNVPNLVLNQQLDGDLSDNARGNDLTNSGVSFSTPSMPY